MSTSQSSRVRLSAINAKDGALIREELEHLTRNPHFAGSKRYPALLRYIVEKTLEGHADELKERTLGMDVFHRPPDYDTNNDTVVRVTAGEVRKRLALVYHESRSDHTVQIVLPTGSYTPEFLLLPSDSIEIEASASPSILPQVSQQERPSSTRSRAVRPRHVLLTASVLTGVFLLAWGLARRSRSDAIDMFWQPMLTSQSPILISPGAMVFSATVAGATKADNTVDYPYVSFATASSLADLGTLLARSKERYVVVPSSTLTLTDIRGRPVVLLGAYNNDWSQRAMSDLRYRFTPQDGLAIFDSTNPAVRWTRPVSSTPYSEADDYAIVARFHSTLTESPILVLAGLGKNGTEAAAQFVTDPVYLNALGPTLPKDWATKNIEMVIKTRVIHGRTGEPSLEAVHFW